MRLLPAGIVKKKKVYGGGSIWNKSWWVYLETCVKQKLVSQLEGIVPTQA